MIVIALCLGAFAYMLGVAVTFERLTSQWHRDAIQRGFAEYDPQTGKWRWKPTPEQNPLTNQKSS